MQYTKNISPDLIKKITCKYVAVFYKGITLFILFIKIISLLIASIAISKHHLKINHSGVPLEVIPRCGWSD